MSKIEDLVSKFHAIEGNALSERRRNFSQLLRQLQSDLTSEEDLQSFLTSLTPETPLEESYFIDILNAFNRNEELLKILKAGNPVHIGKLLKNWKFFRTAFESIDEYVLVNEIFAHVSFSTRMKIINRLYKNLGNEVKADAYFGVIEEQYGLKIASAILPVCSIDLIKSVVEKYKLKLTTRQLLAIVKKQPKFLDFYFEQLRDVDFSRDYQQVLKYSARTDPAFYWELVDKYKLKIKFGRYMTPKVLQEETKILKDDQRAAEYFNRRKLAVFFRKNEQLLFDIVLSRCPKNFQDFPDTVCSILELVRFFPRAKQYQVIRDAFVKTYAKNLIDLDSWSEDFLKLMPAEEREVILNVRVPQDDNLIYLYPPKKSIAMLKDKIKHTSDTEKRTKLICQLVETCKICKDSDSLLAVLKYYLFRHKNDLNVLNDFTRRLVYWPKIEKLGAEHWKCLNELAKVISIANKISNREFDFMQKHLHYLWDNQLAYEEHLKPFLEYIADNYSFIDVSSYNKKYQKICLEHFLTLIPQVFQGDKYKDMCRRILTAVMNYNEKNSDDQISIQRYPDIIAVVKELAKFEDYHCQVKDIVNYIVRSAQERDGIYDPFFWENYSKMHTCQMLIWYIKNDPVKISENLDKVLLELPKSTQCSFHRFFRLRRKCPPRNCLLDGILKKLAKFSHLNIPENLLEFALETLKNKSAIPEHVDHAVKILTHFGTAGQCLYYYYQTDESTHQKFAKNLRFVNPPYATLELLLELSTPKYIQALQRSLYVIINNTPENTANDFFATFHKFPESFKKHAINLTIAIATKEGIYEFLKQAGAGETSDPLRRIIFKLTMQYFVQNPSERFWDLFKSNINLVDPRDREVHVALLNLNRIPYNYRPKYVPLIYQLLAERSDRNINKKKYDLLEHIPQELMGQLTIDFIKRAITDTFFNQELLKNNLGWTALKFFFYAPKEYQLELLQLMSSILKSHTDEKDRTDLFNVLSDICKNFINFRIDVELIKKFHALWSATFKPDEYFEENLLLDFTCAYVENSIEVFASAADKILASVVDTFGSTVVDLFADVLHTFLCDFANVLHDDEKKGKFFERFCAARRSPQAFIVAIMMSVKMSSAQDEGVLKMMQECETPAVQVYLKHYATVVDDDNFLYSF